MSVVRFIASLPLPYNTKALAVSIARIPDNEATAWSGAQPDTLLGAGPTSGGALNLHGGPRVKFQNFRRLKKKTHRISLPYALLIILKQTYPSEKCVLFILCMISFKFSRFVCRFGRINSRNGAPGSTSVQGRVKRAQSLLSSNSKPINLLNISAEVITYQRS